MQICNFLMKLLFFVIVTSQYSIFEKKKKKAILGQFARVKDGYCGYVIFRYKTCFLPVGWGRRYNGFWKSLLESKKTVSKSRL